jgi:o-succinylbenzoate synthase
MKLEKLELEPLLLKLKTPLVTAGKTYRERQGWRLQLVDSDGARGRGEVMPLAEAPDSARPAIEKAWAEQLIGRPLPTSVEEIEQLLAGAGMEATPAARHGLELALLDLASRRAGLPLSRFLVNGRAREEVQVNALLSGRIPGALGDEARAAVERGFKTLKLKVGGVDLSEDAHRLRAVRRAVGESIALRVDANGTWSEGEASTALRGLSPLQLELCEQPVAANNPDGLRRVRQRVPCLIAADEAVSQEGGVEAIFDPEGGFAADVLVLKPMVLGGLLPALRLAERAHAAGLDAYVTSSLDGVVARAGAAHLAASIPQSKRASGLATGALFEPENEADPYQPQQGRVKIPEAPGLGL